MENPAELRDRLKEKARSLPDSPGVYLMKNTLGRVIYVGKAKSLPKRVSTYFQKHPGSVRTARLVSRVADFDYLTTDTEKEALILENSLIKKHKPKYNVILRDDKTYPLLRLNVQEPFPWLEVVRRVSRDGAVYFGPFSSASSMRRTMRVIRDLFPIRQCRRPDVRAVDRPCLNHQLGRCLAPCRGFISPEEYRAMVDDLIHFFQGRNKTLTDELRRRMKEASDRLDFEAAARFRDRLAAVERTIERQNVVSPDRVDRDVIGLARDRGQAEAVVLFIRNGALLGRQIVSLGGTSDSPQDIIAAFLGQYYSRDNLIPREVLIPVRIEDQPLIQDWLREKKGQAVDLISPARGPKKNLLDLAAENAANSLAEKLRTADLGLDALIELQARLGLSAPPRRIEAYDMSNLRGEAPVGAMVVLEDGAFVKSDYRRFKIKTASGQDDYAMMSEVLGRRLSREDPPRPDLMLLDGGRGQLGVVGAVIHDLGLTDPPPLAGLAKGRDGEADRVWLPGRKNPVDFRPDSPGLLLLMRIRDEAHRFVQAYHHRLRARSLTLSVLDQVPGIGPTRRKALLEHFGSIEAVLQAPVEDLMKVKGFGRAAAQALFDHFHEDD